MTRTDVVASSRPLEARAAHGGNASPKAARKAIIYAIAAFAAVMVLALPGAALASEPTSSYTTTAPPPTTTPTTPTTPTSTTPTTPTSTTPTTPAAGTSPSKESSSPSTSTTAASGVSAEPSKSTLPFTGFDLRWTIAIGLLLIAAGASIMVVQRRARRGSDH